MIKSNNFMEGVFHKIRRPNPWEAGNYINCYSQGILVHVERLNFNEEGLNKNPRYVNGCESLYVSGFAKILGHNSLLWSASQAWKFFKGRSWLTEIWVLHGETPRWNNHKQGTGSNFSSYVISTK
ncbi:hypothetical protein F8388_016420 [Cannabis sativa]|uniref:Uncharacterized protein n=1 Tax=Cannabis sativa TaxID=3483 RepID=A0A7J6ETR2_CANSA|nr:hypothetical protein G4B88_015955 [Cannabis sativa]KAF4386168.1 hypothetical protein F8388_016420 [Cannabis sativa]